MKDSSKHASPTLPSRFDEIRTCLLSPRLPIHLDLASCESNDPFFKRMVLGYFKEATSRHRRFPLFGRWEFGVAACTLPRDFESHYMAIDGSARRNHKKAERLGYKATRFDYNSELDAVRAIWISTPVRQGLLPEDIRKGEVKPVSDPPSLNPTHDYVYLGVREPEKGRLVAYAALLVSGEFANINDIYGHIDFQKDAVVPFLIVEAARYLYAFHPGVRHFGYGMYFGASSEMKRFKRKFNFDPRWVRWKLERS